jgi:hypothetical protein
MLRRVRERVSRGEHPPGPADPLIFADHEEIRDIARQMSRTRVELDRSVLALRGWARDLTRRLAQHPAQVDQGVDLRALGETVGGLAHNFNNSLAAILPTPSCSSRTLERHRPAPPPGDPATCAGRRCGCAASGSWCREPQVAFGPVALAEVAARRSDTAPRWRTGPAARHAIAVVLVASVPPVEGNGSSSPTP